MKISIDVDVWTPLKDVKELMNFIKQHPSVYKVIVDDDVVKDANE